MGPGPSTPGNVGRPMASIRSSGVNVGSSPRQKGTGSIVGRMLHKDNLPKAHDNSLRARLGGANSCLTRLSCRFNPSSHPDHRLQPSKASVSAPESALPCHSPPDHQSFPRHVTPGPITTVRQLPCPTMQATRETPCPVSDARHAITSPRASAGPIILYVRIGNPGKCLPCHI